MNFSFLTAAFTSSWALVANLFSKIPYLKTALSVVSGPFGMILGPLVQGIVSAVTSVANFVVAYIKVFFDGLKITLQNLSVLAVIFATLVGGIAYGIHLDRAYLPVRVAKVSDCSAVISQLHAEYWFLPKKK